MPTLEILEIIDNVGPLILSGILTFNLIQFSTLKKNTRAQTEHQILADIFQARTRLEDTETFTNMAKESEQFKERFSLVNKPSEYYTVVAFQDLLEHIFRLHKNRMIDDDTWNRWQHFTEIVMTIPKFQKLWEITKHSHTKEFADFIDGVITNDGKTKLEFSTVDKYG